MIIPSSSESIKQAAESLQAGQVVAFPTETVYGLGANALDDNAVQKIFALKSRPASNPLIVHVPSIDHAFELIDLNADKKIINRFRKISRFWPGPLSLIVPKIKEISDLVSAGGKTIAIRVPKHPVALELLRAVKLPIAAPSANKSFAISPTTAQHVQHSFDSASLLILDGGPCTVGLESTVLDISSEIVRVMRPGAISTEQIMHTLEERCICESIKVKEDETQNINSPGLFDLHYAPITPLVFIEDLDQLPSPYSDLGVILFSPELVSKFEGKSRKKIILSPNGDLEEVARSLYSELRNFDQLGLKLIAIESCAEHGIGAAIMDRLRRARHLP